MSAAVKACDLRKVFYAGNDELVVLDGVDLTVAPGEVVAIMGASGVGKSTLLHILGTLDLPTAGTLSIDGEDVLALNEGRLAAFRNRHIGFVFQFHHLLPEFTALENVMLPALVAGHGGEQARCQALGLLRAVALEGRLEHRPGELSGGECQRVAVARALVMCPPVVLADEPSGNLDTATSTDLHSLMRQLSRLHSQAVVVMTHDRSLANTADRTGILEAGRLRF